MINKLYWVFGSHFCNKFKSICHIIIITNISHQYFTAVFRKTYNYTKTN